MTAHVLLALAALVAQTGGAPTVERELAPAAPAPKAPAPEAPEAAAPVRVGGEKPAVDLTADDPPPSEWDRQKATGRGEGAGESASDERSFIGQVGQTLIALLVICGILYLFGKLALSRLSNVRFGGGKSQRIKLVERLQLEPRLSLYLVDVDERGPRFLLGTSDKGVRMIATVERSAAPAPAPGPADKPSFKDALLKAAGVRREPAAAPQKPAKDDDDSIN